METTIFWAGAFAPVLIGGILAIIGFYCYEKNKDRRFMTLPYKGAIIMLFSFLFIGYGYFNDALVIKTFTGVGMTEIVALIYAGLLPFIINGMIRGISNRVNCFDFRIEAITNIISVMACLMSAVFMLWYLIRCGYGERWLVVVVFAIGILFSSAIKRLIYHPEN